MLPLAYFGAFYISLNSLTLAPQLERAVNVVGLAVLVIFAARLGVIFVGYAFSLYLKKSGEQESLKRSLAGVLKLAKVIIWGLAIIFFLDNMGFEISTVLAGLGIGGVAVALAASVILKDLFSYFSILFDKPFEVGDFIIIGDFLGTIEHIEIKSPRLDYFIEPTSLKKYGYFDVRHGKEMYEIGYKEAMKVLTD